MTKVFLGGRPLKFQSPAELRDILQQYFDTTPPEEYTVTGLALLVGSKQLLNDYEKREEYKDIVTEAKLIVENGYEIDLKKHGRTGTIFALKNFDWKDKNETDLTSDGKPIFQIISYGSENNNNPVQLPTESIPATIPTKSGEIQDSSNSQESGEIKDGTQPTDTEKSA